MCVAPFLCVSSFAEPDYLRKLCERKNLPTRLAQLAHPMVFTNGVFDILHKGHAQYLAQARSLGQSLIVALNTDSSARRLGKGADRPIHQEQDRAELIAALASTDLVTWFEEDTPLALLALVRPEIFVKGGDYDVESLPETPLVRSWGGTVLTVPFVAGYSTTTLVHRIRATSPK